MAEKKSIEQDIQFCFKDQDRDIPISGLLVHISFHPPGKMTIYFKPSVTDKNGCISLKHSEISQRVEDSEAEPSLYFCDLPDTRKTNRFEVRVLNQSELLEDYEMKKLFSSEISRQLQKMIDQCCNKAYQGRKLICDIEPEISISLTKGF